MKPLILALANLSISVVAIAASPVTPQDVVRAGKSSGNNSGSLTNLREELKNAKPAQQDNQLRNSEDSPENQRSSMSSEAHDD